MKDCWLVLMPRHTEQADRLSIQSGPSARLHTHRHTGGGERELASHPPYSLDRHHGRDGPVVRIHIHDALGICLLEARRGDGAPELAGGGHVVAGPGVEAACVCVRERERESCELTDGAGRGVVCEGRRGGVR